MRIYKGPLDIDLTLVVHPGGGCGFSLSTGHRWNDASQEEKQEKPGWVQEGDLYCQCTSLFSHFPLKETNRWDNISNSGFFMNCNEMNPLAAFCLIDLFQKAMRGYGAVLDSLNLPFHLELTFLRSIQALQYNERLFWKQSSSIQSICSIVLFVFLDRSQKVCGGDLSGILHWCFPGELFQTWVGSNPAFRESRVLKIDRWMNGCDRFAMYLLSHLVALFAPIDPAGSDQRQGGGDPGPGWSQRPHSTPHHSRMGQVLPTAVGRLLPPPVVRCHPLLHSLHHPVFHGGTDDKGQCEITAKRQLNSLCPVMAHATESALFGVEGSGGVNGNNKVRVSQRDSSPVWHTPSC